MSTTLMDLADDRTPTGELPQPTTSRWRPLRAGLQNIWQYDHTTRFVFHDGRLLLRGRNGVGKTKVVEVLLPFLLEGSMQPNRLDPFGSRSRRMHFNLLHDGNTDQQSAVAYVWLEFGRLDQDGQPRFATVGAGLKARRSSDQVDSWFFTTSLRVDEHLHPVDATRTPLSRPALEEALGAEGQVLQTAREYRTAVNRLLFDVPAPQYEAMVDALLRLRQPHLSERLEPAELDTVLSDSLPPLDEDRLREVAEGFDRLEAHRTELADRRRSLRAVEEFLGIYAEYAAVVAAVRGRDVTRADYGVRSAAEAERTAQAQRDDALAERDELEARIEEVTGQLHAAEERLLTLKQSDAYRAVQDLDQAENAHTAATRRADEAVERLDRSREDLAAATAELDEADRGLEERAGTVERLGREARGAAGEADLVDEQAGVGGRLLGRDELDDEGVTTALATARGALGAVADDRRAAIARVRGLQADVDAADDQVERAGAVREDADAAVRDATSTAAEAEDAVTAARDEFADRVRHWADEADTLGLHEDVVTALVDADPEDAAAAARAEAAPRREELDEGLRTARRHLDEVTAERAAVRAERDEVAASTHQPPDVPDWRTTDREGRPGAPFYLQFEFTDALASHEQANVEAALDALGLLDAWVLPDGTFLDEDDHDVVLLQGTDAPGRTLADVTRPAPVEGMWEDTIPLVLRRIAVRDDSDLAEVPESGLLRDGADWFPDGGTAYVTTGGRFCMGPLDGRTAGTEVRYIGAAARERARQRRLEELDTSLAELGERHASTVEALDGARTRRQRLDEELDRFPPAGPVVQARATALAAADRLATAREQLASADEALRSARTALEDARSRRDAMALEVGLAAHVARLDDLEEAGRTWHRAVESWLHAIERWAETRRRRAGLGERVARLTERVADDEAAAVRETGERDRLTERVATLHEMVGADPDDIRSRVRATDEEREQCAREQQELAARKDPLLERVGSAKTALEHAVEAHQQAVDNREDATAAFVALVDLGVLRVLEVDVDDDPHDWGVRAALDHARQVVAAGPELPEDPEALQGRVEQVENQLTGRQQQLLRDAVGDLRPALHREHGVWIPQVRYGGRLQLLDAVADELRTDVAEREARLHTDEQGLLETFLTGELHEHLRSRIRDASGLVDTMNDRLVDCATTAGHRVRLRWEVADDAAPGTAEAIDLLLRGRNLITDDQRADLRSFLQERLRGAREGDAAASLQERIGNAFDYRRWHQFAIQFRDSDAAAWRRLTRQSHGAGSGGEKAVMLHLPLFAAMAAHYEAAPTAPRLIVLDEVFAGIDRETRGQLMGLLVELDLDALLTSHDEWGFYAELDGLSTYHLVRDPGMAGVLAEWFVWDGATRWEMGT